MSFRVWLAGDEASARSTAARSALDAAAEIGDELVGDGAASVTGGGCSFDLIVEHEDGARVRFRAQAPPAFVLEEVECCRACGRAEDDTETQGWASDDLCNACAGLHEDAA